MAAVWIARLFDERVCNATAFPILVTSDRGALAAPIGARQSSATAAVPSAGTVAKAAGAPGMKVMSTRISVHADTHA